MGEQGLGIGFAVPAFSLRPLGSVRLVDRCSIALLSPVLAQPRAPESCASSLGTARTLPGRLPQGGRVPLIAGPWMPPSLFAWGSCS